MFAGGCGGTDTDAKYVQADWETAGPGAVVSNCATSNDEDGNTVEVFAPENGNKVESYTLYARNCMTCREDRDIKDKIWIRYQTNNMPNHCYGTDAEATFSADGFKYPSTQKMDFEVVWNPDVLYTKNTADSAASNAATTSSLLCNV